MKYFPPKLWLGFNSRSEKLRRAADRTWKSNFKRYQNSLKKILPMLSLQARSFFSRPLQLHDGSLIRVEVGDHVGATKLSSKALWNRRNARMKLLALSSNGKFICELDYKLVARAELNFPGAIPLFPAGQYPNFGDWGYDEFSIVGDGLFRHEILFSSGASISIEFRKLSVRRRSLK